MSLFKSKQHHWFPIVLKSLAFAGVLFLIARFFLRAVAKELRLPPPAKRRFEKSEMFV